MTSVFRGLIGGENPATAKTAGLDIGGVTPAKTPVNSEPGQTPPGTTGYTNPLARATGTLYQRVDMGVDFTGSGPILAVGDGVVIETSGSGWPGGPFMSYRLTSGPMAGKVIYIAEQIHPTVRPGQKITQNQTIALMSGYIEMGWADSTGTRPESQTSEAGNISGANLPAGGTLIGRDFEAFLRALGVQPANNLNAPTGGIEPPGYPGSY